MIYAKILFPLNILRTNRQNFAKLYICIHIDKIYVGIHCYTSYLHICTRVMALDLLQNFVSVQYLENKWTDFSKLYISIYTDKIYVGIVSCHFSQFVRELWPFIDVRLMLPLNILRHSGLLLHARYCSGAIVRFSDNSSLRQNFVSTQYLENKLTEFHQILYYAFILTRSKSGLLHVIFHTFVPELWPLIYSKILFPLNILRTNRQILTKLYITNYTDEIYVGIVSCHFSQIL